MDSRQTAQRVADRTGVSAKDAARMIEVLGSVIAEACGNLDIVAIPGFGNFSAEKHDEKVVTDPSTMKRMLMPPAIEPQFKTSVILRNRLKR